MSDESGTFRSWAAASSALTNATAWEPRAPMRWAEDVDVDDLDFGEEVAIVVEDEQLKLHDIVSMFCPRCGAPTTARFSAAELIKKSLPDGTYSSVRNTHHFEVLHSTCDCPPITLRYTRIDNPPF